MTQNQIMNLVEDFKIEFFSYENRLPQFGEIIEYFESMIKEAVIFDDHDSEEENKKIVLFLKDQKKSCGALCA